MSEPVVLGALIGMCVAMFFGRPLLVAVIAYAVLVPAIVPPAARAAVHWLLGI